MKGILGASYIFKTITRSPGTTNTFDASKSGFASNSKEKMGKSKGNMPGNNQVQNAQVRLLVSKYGLSREQQCQLHDLIYGQGYGYHEVEQVIKDYIIK